MEKPEKDSAVKRKIIYLNLQKINNEFFCIFMKLKNGTNENINWIKINNEFIDKWLDSWQIMKIRQDLGALEKISSFQLHIIY